MAVIDSVRIALDEALGTRGALRNCRRERLRRDETERAIRQLCERIPAPQPAEERRTSA